MSSNTHNIHCAHAPLYMCIRLWREGFILRRSHSAVNCTRGGGGSMGSLAMGIRSTKRLLALS